MPTRAAARRAIADRRVVVAGLPAVKPARLVAPDDVVALVDSEEPWASRGGLKLAGVLEPFGIDPAGHRCLDVGASTGGFTDVLLRRGAAAVTAVDVGYGQLLWRLQTDPRVVVVDRTNFRTLDARSLDPPFDLVTVDVSFISVTLLASNLAAVGKEGTEYVVLVKPQFEAGRHSVGKGGLVRDPEAWARSVESVAGSLLAAGVGFLDVAPSPIEGAAGNREFFVHARRGADSAPEPEAIRAVVGS